jgi:hypothetical protein
MTANDTTAAHTITTNIEATARAAGFARAEGWHVYSLHPVSAIREMAKALGIDHKGSKRQLANRVASVLDID